MVARGVATGAQATGESIDVVVEHHVFEAVILEQRHLYVVEGSALQLAVAEQEAHLGLHAACKGAYGIAQHILKILYRVVEQLLFGDIFLILQQLHRSLAATVRHIGGGHQHLLRYAALGVYLYLRGLYAFACQLLVEHLAFLTGAELVGVDKLVVNITAVGTELVEHLARLVLQALEVRRELALQIDTEKHRLIDAAQHLFSRLGEGVPTLGGKVEPCKEQAAYNIDKHHYEHGCAKLQQLVAALAFAHSGAPLPPAALQHHACGKHEEHHHTGKIEQVAGFAEKSRAVDNAKAHIAESAQQRANHKSHYLVVGERRGEETYGRESRRQAYQTHIRACHGTAVDIALRVAQHPHAHIINHRRQEGYDYKRQARPKLSRHYLPLADGLGKQQLHGAAALLFGKHAHHDCRYQAMQIRGPWSQPEALRGLSTHC